MKEGDKNVNMVDALTEALVLAITAPTEEQSAKAVALADRCRPDRD